jgi:hypothetical protein
MTLATAWFAAITLMLDEGAMIGLYRMTTGNTENGTESQLTLKVGYLTSEWDLLRNINEITAVRDH